jgi:hypothetical protein
MVLMFRDGHDVEFFLLSHNRAKEQPFYSLSPWPAGEARNIEIHASDAPSVVVKAVTRGVPIPRHGSLLGWSCGNDITALVAFYAKYSFRSPKPYWAMMPLADISESSWPPLTGERFFGCWFWEYYRAGSISSLDELIARTPGTVFWVNTKDILGSDCCAVARDITSPEGHILRRGRYVYCEALREGKPVPPLQTLLAAMDKADLASRFHLSEDKPSDYAVVARARRHEQCRPVPVSGGTGRSRPGEKSRSALFARFRHTTPKMSLRPRPKA